MSVGLGPQADNTSELTTMLINKMVQFESVFNLEGENGLICPLEAGVAGIVELYLS